VDKKYYLILLILSAGILYFSTGGSGSSAIPKNMGYPINTRGDDFCPSLNGEGTMLVFSSREKGEGDHNIFMCVRDGATWSRPLEIKEINTEFNEETPFISADASVILFASDRPGSMRPSITANRVERVTYDIYYVKKTETGWSTPEPVPGDVNTAKNERAPALSADKMTLYFTRWPFKDLQRSRLMRAFLKGEVFINSEELPHPVNSGNYEIGLREAPGGTGFYFSSMRPGGYGGWDIYYVSYTRGTYGRIQNLGPEINSQDNDLFFTATPYGRYLCSNRPGSLGRYDLFAAETGEVPVKKELFPGTANMPEKKSLETLQVPLPEEKAPAGVTGKTRITFTIIDEKTGMPLSMKFRVYLKNSPDPAVPALRSVIRQSDSRGRFTVVPKSDVTHLMVVPETRESIAMQSVKVDPYREKSVSIVISSPDSGKKIDELPPVTSLPGELPEHREKSDRYREAPIEEPRGAVSLQNILFDTNSVNIRLEYYPYIHNLIDHLRKNPGARLLITGHADRRGSEQANEALSLNRAMAVRDYLVRMGIDETRIKTRGLGDRMPLVKDRLLSQANRRVEFKLY